MELLGGRFVPEDNDQYYYELGQTGLKQSGGIIAGAALGGPAGAQAGGAAGAALGGK